MGLCGWFGALLLVKEFLGHCNTGGKIQEERQSISLLLKLMFENMVLPKLSWYCLW